MTFIRPEARAALWRWREVLAGFAIGILGSWWMAGPGGLLGYLGVVLILAGAALVAIGVPRGRFRKSDGRGPGSVDIDEGQITYFGPLTGGAMALRDVTQLALMRTGVTQHWRLSAGNDDLYIPVNADGADALFDAFAAFDGLKTERLLNVMQNEEPHDTVIWSRDAVRKPTDRLH